MTALGLVTLTSATDPLTRYLQREAPFQDVRLVAADEQEVRAHGVVLAAAYPLVRAAMLSVSEASADDSAQVILLPDFTRAEVEGELLRAAYGELTDPEVAESSSVIRECLLYRSQEVDVDSVKGVERAPPLKVEIKEEVSSDHDEEDDLKDDSLTSLLDVEFRQQGQGGHRLSRKRLRSPSDDSRLASKISRKSGKNLVSCPLCNAVVWKSSLDGHIARKHTKTPTIECGHCEKKFFAPRDVEIHRNKAHGVATDDIVCELCDRHFTSRAVFKRHYVKCKKNPSRRQHFIFRASRDDPSLCPAIGCEFRSEDHRVMRKHYRKEHEKQICPYCAKIYAFYTIKEHIAKEHTKELHFPCSYCSERFFNKTLLREHTEIEHIKKPLYMCDKCGEGFFSRKLVARHKSDAHVSKHHPCTECNKVYMHKKSLKCHMSAVHGIEMPT